MTSLVGSTVDVSLRLLVTSLRANQRLPFFLVNNKKSAFRVSRKKPADMEPFEPTMKQLLADVVGVETLCWDDVNCLGDYAQLAMAPPPPSPPPPPPQPPPQPQPTTTATSTTTTPRGFYGAPAPSTNQVRHFAKSCPK